MQNTHERPIPDPTPGRNAWIAIAVVLAVVLALLGWGVWYYMGKRQIASRGGLYFHTALAVPEFRQGDPRWRGDLLGKTNGTLGAQGCAVASAAMVLSWYGVETDPARLNRFLTQHGGYEGEGWLVWEKAAELAGGGIEKAYEDLPAYCKIDCELLHGTPVIVRIRFPSGTTHFVVVAGKHGFDYLIRDPGAGWNKGLYPLRELAGRIEALRFYRRTGLPVKTLPVPAPTPAPTPALTGTNAALTTGS